MTTLLKNGKVIDYKSQTEEFLDILIADDKISKIGKNLRKPSR